MDRETRARSPKHVSSKEVDEAKKREIRRGMKQLVQRATHDTTVHGIRYIFDTETTILRRFLWILIVIACAAFFGRQLYVRFTDFKSNPKSVNVEMIYPKSLRFPQVLLCNHNAFKITSLYPALFRSVKTFFMAQPDQITPELVEQIALYDRKRKTNTGSYTNMTEVYLDSRHLMEDMLLDCKYKGRNCSAANFSVVMSQHGACYQFVSSEDEIEITSPGSSSGLRLIMNIEQYAYGFGQRHSAGLDVFFKDAEEPPVINENGVSVQPGGETSIGLDMSEMVELPRPGGDCDDLSLKYTNQYSRAACRQECLTDFIYQKCSCKTPSMSGNIPYCDLITLYNCSYPLQAKFYQLPESASCDCPPKCQETTYTPLLNYAPISQFMTSMIMEYFRSYLGTKILHDIVRGRDVLTYHGSTTADITAKDSQAMMDTITKPGAKFVDIVKPLFTSIANISDMLQQFYKNSSYPSSPTSPSSLSSPSSPSSQVLQTLVSEIRSDLDSLFLNLTTIDLSNFCAGAFIEYSTSFAAVQYCYSWFFLGFYGRTETFQMIGINGTRFTPEYKYLQKNLKTTCQSIGNKIDQILALTIDNDTDYSKATVEIHRMVKGLIEAADSVQPVLDEMLLEIQNLSLYAAVNIPHIGLEVIDERFVKENFIRVNIFFNDIRLTKVTKQLSDSFVSLLCDIGGNLGLCLGASIMSIYELLDFVVSVVLLHRKQNKL